MPHEANGSESSARTNRHPRRRRILRGYFRTLCAALWRSGRRKQGWSVRVVAGGKAMLEKGDSGKDARDRLRYELVQQVERVIRKHLKDDVLLYDWSWSVHDAIEAALMEHERKMAAAWFAGVSRN